MNVYLDVLIIGELDFSVANDLNHAAYKMITAIDKILRLLKYKIDNI